MTLVYISLYYAIPLISFLSSFCPLYLLTFDLSPYRFLTSLSISFTLFITNYVSPLLCLSLTPFFSSLYFLFSQSSYFNPLLFLLINLSFSLSLFSFTSYLFFSVLLFFFRPLFHFSSSPFRGLLFRFFLI